MNLSSSVSKHTTLAYQRAQVKESFNRKSSTKNDTAVRKSSEFIESNKGFMRVCDTVLNMRISTKDAMFVQSIKDYFLEYNNLSQKQKDAVSAIYIKYAC